VEVDAGLDLASFGMFIGIMLQRLECRPVNGLEGVRDRGHEDFDFATDFDVFTETERQNTHPSTRLLIARSFVDLLLTTGRPEIPKPRDMCSGTKEYFIVKEC
jgi:hypothetical protein